MSRRALQGNAADPQQVRYAERKAKRDAEAFAVSLHAVMGAPEGRLVMWTLLERAGIYQSVFDAQGSKVYYNAGRQDYGHELLALIIENDEQAYLLMESEARRRARATDRESEAVQAAATRESSNGSD